ncbi:type VII secretion system-associated protein [Nocardia tengchongensis]|uniref:type VII secretion system-associated protein n=1 Tax=Nocardia tengchongensis TaxID=2055889 RepID=UPI0036CCE116
MEHATSLNAMRHGDWLVLIDASWQESTPESIPPSAAMLGGWLLDGGGNPGPFQPNPTYVPVDDSTATDPIDAVLRSASDVAPVGSEIIAALRGAVVEIACDSNDEPLVVSAPDGAACVAVATAAVHKHRVVPDRWWSVVGSVLPDIVPASVDILLNPGSPAQFRLHTRMLRHG